jgi:TonB family protein
VVRRVELALLFSCVAFLLCFRCPAQQPGEATAQPARSPSDFDVKFVNDEILVRRKGADKWEDKAQVEDPVEVALPDGGNVYILTKAIKVPKMKHAPDPDFPPEAKRQHKEGQVAMHAVVDEQGRVRSQTVYASSGPEFTNAAIQAVQKWVFEPARLDGQPVSVLINITMNFRLY